jgi:hypothetical protein
MRLERIDLLVTGAPVHQFGSHATRLKELLTGTHTIRPRSTVEIVDVKVAIQPVGGLIAYTREVPNWKHQKDRTYLLIDPGYFTFDWILSKGLNEIPGKSGRPKFRNGKAWLQIGMRLWNNEDGLTGPPRKKSARILEFHQPVEPRESKGQYLVPQSLLSLLFGEAIP